MGSNPEEHCGSEFGTENPASMDLYIALLL
jgi:hypothetical protein